MSYVAKTYEFIDKVQKLFNKKLFNVLFISIASMFLFFGAMNAYAVGENADGTIDTTQVTMPETNWKGIKIFINLANGLGKLNKNQDNMGTQGLTSLANFATIGNALFASKLTAGAADIQEDSDVPEDMKNGLLGISDNAITYAYSEYPTTNITGHLAEEWVPGYKDGNSSVYAAQDGYETLIYSGVGDLWNIVRNIAYVFFVIVMIVVGFMIMFRSKIGGQTLVTLGNFLPGVITSLILITFSFAIAGILIDIGGIITSLIAGIYTAGGGSTSAINTIPELFSSMFTGGTAGIAVGATGLSAITTGIAAIAVGAASTIAGGAGIFFLLIALVMFGIIFVAAIKVIITLYKAYFGILLNVIIAPIPIMIGAFPGKGYSTTNWFLTLLRHVLTFPMVFAIVNLPGFIAGQDAELQLELPAALSGNTVDGTEISLNSGFGGFLTMFVLRIAALYFAAQAPKYLEAWFPANTPKPVAEGLAKAQESLTKIPLVGGLFK